MSIFTPVYRPTEGQQGLLARQQKRERKRKREQDDYDDSSDEEISGPTKVELGSVDLLRPTSSFRPINRTDPNHVAGLSWEASRPPPPFPHGPSSNRAGKEVKPVEEELASLNPPLYVSKEVTNQDRVTSSKRRHVDNITTILHQCMLKEDWKRASRAWGLLLRTEIAGRGTDARQNGRWGIGAEILMRSHQQADTAKPPRQASTSSDDDEAVQPRRSEPIPQDRPPFSDEGFGLAKDYYERLILQYPYLPRAGHQSINAVVFYPALFNIWIYEVQDRSERARRDPRLNERDGSTDDSEHSASSGAKGVHLLARTQAVTEASAIAHRMDELMLSPPYDSSSPLLQLRGMLGLWLADLHAAVADAGPNEDGESEHERQDDTEIGHHLQQERAERQKGIALLRKVRRNGDELSQSVVDLLDTYQDDSS